MRAERCVITTQRPARMFRYTSHSIYVGPNVRPNERPNVLASGVHAIVNALVQAGRTVVTSVRPACKCLG